MRWFPLFLVALAPSLAWAWQPNGVQLTGAAADQQRPLLASDGAGGAYVSWIDYRASQLPPNFKTDLYLQHVTATGQIAPGWPADGQAVTAGPRSQFGGSILPDGSGGVLFLYGDTSVDQGDLYLQRVTAAGTIALGWPAGGFPVAVAPGHQSDAEMAGDGTGGAFVSWQDGFRAFYTHVLGTG